MLGLGGALAALVAVAQDTLALGQRGQRQRSRATRLASQGTRIPRWFLILVFCSSFMNACSTLAAIRRALTAIVKMPLARFLVR